MVDICQICGDKGFPEALNYCKKCQVYPIHRYCLDVLPKSFDKCVTWFCEDCEEKETPRKKSKAKFRNRWLFQRLCIRMKKKKVKRKRKDNIGSMTKIEAHVGQRISPLQLHGADARDKSEDSALERSGGSVQEDVANHGEITNDKPDFLDSAFERPGESVQEDAANHREITNGKSDFLDSALERPGVSVQEDAANHGEITQDKSDYLDSALERPAESVQGGAANHGKITNNKSDLLGHNCLVAQPIVDPVWRGGLKFRNISFQNVCLLVAHMSSLACSKVYEEAKVLPGLLYVELLRRCDIWPKGFAKLGPTDQSIALYFFPEDKGSEKVFDILVDAMMLKDFAMRAVLNNAELLVFTSSMLPMQYWRFQTRYYLWGVFRGKQGSEWRNNAASKEKDVVEALNCIQRCLSPSSHSGSTHSGPLYSTDSPSF